MEATVDNLLTLTMCLGTSVGILVGIVFLIFREVEPIQIDTNWAEDIKECYRSDELEGYDEVSVL